MFLVSFPPGDRVGDDPRDPPRLQRPAGGERVDGHRDEAGGRGQGQLHEREDRIPGVHHQQDQAGGGVSKCKFKHC